MPQISLAEQLLYKKTEPSFVQPKKRLAPARWSDTETKQFYRILQLIGMDFTVMEQFFPKRNRKQLLRKFHKEKKNNPKEVERALQNNQKINGTANKEKFKWLMDNSIDLKFSDTNSSSFDSTDQMINNHIKNILEENQREKSNESDIRSINFYLEKLNDEEKTTLGESKSENQLDNHA